MANTIRIKRRDAGGSAGAPSTLENAELAFNEADLTLYYGFGTGGGGGSATSIIKIGGTGAFATLDTTQTISGNKTFSGTTSLTGAVSVSGSGTISIPEPTLGGHAASKTYVDNAIASVVQGLDVKDSVRAASTANVPNLSSVTTIDGVTLGANDRVLLKDQSTGSQNGIYTHSGGVLSRSTDANTSAKVTAGMYCFVTEGSTNADKGFILTTNDTITLGTTALVFTQFSGSAAYVAGDGLTLTGDTFAVGTASASRIVVNANDIDLATTGVSASTYKSVTVDVYGRVTGGTNPTTLSGYGITDAVANTRTLTASTGLTGGGDLSADRSFALTGQALALHNLASNGIIARTGSGTVANRTVTGTTNRVTVTNGDGVAGNPTIDIASNYVGQSTITTLGTISTGVWNGTAVSLQYGGTGSNLSAAADGAIFKKSGTSLIAATVGTDYLSSASDIDGGTF